MREWIAQSRENHDKLDKVDALKQLDWVRDNPYYTKQVNEKRTEFHNDYWRLANDIAPDLQMDKPDIQGKKGDWVYIHRGNGKAIGLDCQIWFFHKLFPNKKETGFVEIQFYAIKTQETWDKLKKIIDASTGNGIYARPPTEKTIFVTIDVPRVYPDENFEMQKDNIITGISAAQKLYQWVLKNIDGYEKAN